MARPFAPQSAGKIWLAICLFLASLCAVRGLSSSSSALCPQAIAAPAERRAFPTTKPIEAIQVGDRVLGENPTGDEDLSFGADIDPATWRKLHLLATKRDGTYADVILLRPDAWLAEHGVRTGGTIDISVPDCGIEGTAEVMFISSCPSVQKGRGHVVTGTFHHHSAKVIHVTVAGLPEPIGTTANHPFWSEDRQEFVRADKLQPGDTLRTARGTTEVIEVTADLASHPVYNLEIQFTHVYHVGQTGVLVHNGIFYNLPILTCADDAAEKAKQIADDAINAAPHSGGGLVPTLQGNIPQGDKWIRARGRVIYHTDGSMTYIKNGVSIRYNSAGYPDFSNQLYDGTDGLNEVRITLSTQGSRATRYRRDFDAANAAAGFTNGTPKGYVWHHHEDTGLMQLVREDVHSEFWHSGGMSLNN